MACDVGHNVLFRLVLYTSLPVTILAGGWFYLGGPLLQLLQARATVVPGVSPTLESPGTAMMDAADLENQALLEEKDAETRAITARWTSIIEEATERLEWSRPSISSVTPGVPTSDGIQPHDWAYQPLRQVEPPIVRSGGWVRNPIDQFIWAELERAGLRPQAAASPAVLARRIWFDLIGLPPSPQELSDFVTAGALAYDDAVEGLMAAPEYGEHQARLWLDLSRYADSNGYEEDEIRPHAYPYRDFIIWALNHDLPYDQFIRWQLAGDEQDEHNPLAVAATGFVTAAPFNTFLPQESERYDELDDIVSTLGRVMLGLSVGCARCHDHPYEPIRTEEYYGLVAVFQPTTRHHRYLTTDGGESYQQIAGPVHQRREEVRQILLARVKEDNIAALDFTDEEKDLLRQPIDPTNKEQIRLLSLCGRCLMIDDSSIDDDTQPLPEDQERYQQLKAEIRRLEPLLPPTPPEGLGLAGSGVAEVSVLPKGRFNPDGPSVGPRFLEVLSRAERPAPRDAWREWDPAHDPPRPRTALANWITDLETGAGPLLARVIVNRIWQEHFGRGLVGTPSDFGVQGEIPSHPELLEWLAGELIRSGWSQKHVHSLIVRSATYRQDSQYTREHERLDPENRLFSRWTPRRLTAEMFRDALLTLGGNLNRRMYGPAFQPAIPREAIFNKDEENVDETWPVDVVERPEVWRRSVYILKRRTNPVPLLQLLDAPEGTLSCAKRNNTTVPTQALALWNDRLVRAQCERVADRIVRRTSYFGPRAARLAAQVQYLYFLALGRDADGQELLQTVEFLHQGGRLADLCQVVLMGNEFIYLH